MLQAVENVQKRLLQATAALECAKVPYAVTDDNAVAAHVSAVDIGAVRNTPEIHILIRREDLPAARIALESSGFVYRNAAGIDLFLDGPDASPRNSVQISYAGEKVRPDSPATNPDVGDAEKTEHFRVLSLNALVHVKLAAFRRLDKVHLRDLIDVGLIDEKWMSRLPPELAARLRHLLETPND